MTVGKYYKYVGPILGEKILFCRKNLDNIVGVFDCVDEFGVVQKRTIDLPFNFYPETYVISYDRFVQRMRPYKMSENQLQLF